MKDWVNKAKMQTNVYQAKSDIIHQTPPELADGTEINECYTTTVNYLTLTSDTVKNWNSTWHFYGSLNNSLVLHSIV